MSGPVFWLPEVKMSWEKNSKKKPIIAINFCFLVDFIRPTGPMVSRYTGVLFPHSGQEPIIG